MWHDLTLRLSPMLTTVCGTWGSLLRVHALFYAASQRTLSEPHSLFFRAKPENATFSESENSAPETMEEAHSFWEFQLPFFENLYIPEFQIFAWYTNNIFRLAIHKGQLATHLYMRFVKKKAESGKTSPTTRGESAGCWLGITHGPKKRINCSLFFYVLANTWCSNMQKSERQLTLTAGPKARRSAGRNFKASILEFSTSPGSNQPHAHMPDSLDQLTQHPPFRVPLALF